MLQAPDYHTHTRFSCDSDVTIEAMCQAAVAQGMQEIAITDHADFEPLDACCGYFRPESYWEAIRRCRATFAGQLAIRAGVECGEAHVYYREVAAILSNHEYDLVLGSLHWVGSRPTFDAAFFDGLGLDEGLALYFDALARLAAEGEYDVLAHLDYIRTAAHRRFGPQELDLGRHEARIRQVLRIVAERGKGIEVNTSYRRKAMGNPGPSAQVLRWFREEGGQIVTLGSDAHRPEDVGAAFGEAMAMVQEAGFEGLATFESRSSSMTSDRRKTGVPETTGEKVVAYVTDGNKLLVFSHPHHPDAGIQVPAGTVEEGESLEEAVLREAREETGLNGLEVRSYLGVREVDLSAGGRSAIQHHHFFHLVLRRGAPVRWRHYEEHPSDGSPGPIGFEFFWVELPDGVPELSGGQGALLPELEPVA